VGGDGVGLQVSYGGCWLLRPLCTLFRGQPKFGLGESFFGCHSGHSLRRLFDWCLALRCFPLGGR
jgi:hypothetical protein